MIRLNNLDLISEICQEREWRLKELEFYKKIPYLYVNPLFGKHKEKYYKMCIPMIYAHWEGFIICAFRLLSDFITRQSIQYSYAPEFLILLANKKRFQYLKGNCDLEKQRRFLKEFLLSQKSGIEIPSDSCISANSNLNFKQLELILNSFNLKETRKYKNNKQGIEKLVTFRNKIAHGENSVVVEYNDIDQMVKCVTELIDETIIIIKKYVLEKGYLQF